MKPTTYPATPELDKMRAVKAESETLSSFIDWLTSEKILLCTYQEWEDAPNGFYPIHDTPEKFFARYFDIDLNKVEEERTAVLEWVREQNQF